MIELTRWLPTWMMRFVLRGGLDHLRPIGVEMNHRLFAVDILARVHGIDGSLLVPMVRCGNENSVDILSGQDLLVVTRCKDVAAPEFFAALQPAVVAVSDGHQLHAGNLHGGLRIALALNASPYQRELDVVVGRNRRCWAGLSCRKRVHPGPQQRLRGCCSRGLQKISTVQHVPLSSHDEVDHHLQPYSPQEILSLREAGKGSGSRLLELVVARNFVSRCLPVFALLLRPGR